MDTFGARLKKAIKEDPRERSQAAVARTTGVSEQTLIRWGKRDEAPDLERIDSEENFQKIVATLGIRGEWLLTGKEPMRPEKTAEEKSSAEEAAAEEPAEPGGDGAAGEGAEFADDRYALSEEQLRAIGHRRVYDVEVGAGEEREMELQPVNGGIILPDSYIRSEYGVSPDKLCRLRVIGESMKETLQPGQRVWAARWEGEPYRDGAIYGLQGPQGYSVKRLIFDRIDEEDVIWIWADNDEYTDQRHYLTKEQFDIDYHVFAWALEVGTKL